MPITFGSIGDIISLSLRIKQLVECLNSAHGSSAEYQAVVRELWSLDRAILEIEALFASLGNSPQLNALKATANACAQDCQRCIRMFKEHIQMFKKGLDKDESGNVFKNATSKIRWSFDKEPLAKFRTEVNAHCMSLNMLLLTTGFKATSLYDESLTDRLKRSEEAHDSASKEHTSLLTDIRERLNENNAMVKSATRDAAAVGPSIEKNLQAASAENNALMHKILKMNFMVYRAVASLQTQIPNQLEKAWTQEPTILEDALGRVSPVHMQFIDSWEAFDAILEVRFQQLPGHRKIKQKEFTLRVDDLGQDLERTMPLQSSFLPGRRVSMSMVFDGGFTQTDFCPGCKLFHETRKADLNGEVLCPGCGLTYQRIMKTRQVSALEPLPAASHAQISSAYGASKKACPDSELEDLDDEPARFRRVRLNCWALQYPNQKALTAEKTRSPDQQGNKGRTESATRYQHTTYFVPGYGLSRQVVFSHFQYFLGPFATVRSFSYQQREGYLFSSAGLPLTRSQVEELQRLSREFEEEATERMIKYSLLSTDVGKAESHYLNQPLRVQKRSRRQASDHAG